MTKRIEILKRMVEIEGISHAIDAVGGYSRPWNPLTNPADTFALIEKYKVWIKHDEMGAWAAIEGYDSTEVFNESLPHAICLAIIEAYTP